jgi:hypothetical protein
MSSDMAGLDCAGQFGGEGGGVHGEEME